MYTYVHYLHTPNLACTGLHRPYRVGHIASPVTKVDTDLAWTDQDLTLVMILVTVGS